MYLFFSMLATLLYVFLRSNNIGGGGGIVLITRGLYLTYSVM